MLFKKTTAFVAVTLCMYAQCSYSAISQQFYQEAGSLGEAGAGNGSNALDASTEFYNPAGLVLIPEQEVVFGDNLAMPTYTFNGSTEANHATVFSGDAQGGSFYQQIFLHYAAPISEHWAFGFGVSTPFSQHADWGDQASTAGNSTYARLTTYDVSTDLAYAITPALSIGAGLDFVRVIVSGANFAGTTPENYTSSLSGSQWDTAWHGGILYQFSPMLRLGLAYHSKINYEASGQAQSLDGNGVVLQSTNNFVMTSTLPAYTTASISYQLNPDLGLDASVDYTQWDQADTVTYQNLPTATGISASSTQTYDLQNTWRTALGAHYKLSPVVLWRVGVAYETSPYANTETVYLGAPVGASYDLSTGIEYRYSKTLKFDMGWTHIFYLTENVNTSNVASQSTTTGEFSGSNDILGLQLVWDML